MRHKKWYITILILVVLVSIGMHCMARSTLWLNWRRDMLQSRIAESFAEDAAAYADFAQRMREHTVNGEPFAYYDSAYLNLSEETIRQAEEFIDERGIPYSDIYICGMTSNIYPNDACVFRCTVFMGDEVYCWIDLVHSENWDTAKESVMDTELTPEWRIVVLWGF